MSFVLRPAIPADAENIARVQNASFAHISPRLQPLSVEDPEGFLRYQVERNRGIMAGIEGIEMVWSVAQDPEGGEIVCVMRTSKIEDALATPLVPTTSAPFGGPDQIEFYDFIKKAHREELKNRPHYFLYTMATHPAHQGRGAARALLQYITSLADEKGLPIYLQAMPEAKPIYLRFGWVETGVTQPLPTGAAINPEPIVLTMMLREPQVRVN